MLDNGHLQGKVRPLSDQRDVPGGDGFGGPGHAGAGYEAGPATEGVGAEEGHLPQHLGAEQPVRLHLGPGVPELRPPVQGGPVPLLHHQRPAG